jgi:N-acetylmuramoyl-L-alanine amidase
MFLAGLSDIEILALTIYGEARGEAIEGQIAVGCVIRNRTGVNNSYKEVCLAPKQFSCWNINDPNYPVLTKLGQELLNDVYISDSILRQCDWIAEGITANVILDNTHGSKNYITNKLLKENPPDWAKRLKIVGVIGDQTFLV